MKNVLKNTVTHKFKIQNLDDEVVIVIRLL